MKLFKVNYESKETILNDFERIANKFKNDVYIRINGNCYRVVDFEFYVYSEKFPDPQTHKDELQLGNGKFYFHGSGVDITIGDGVNYGGILIRSIIKMFDCTGPESKFSKKQIEGPLNVVKELFSNLNNLESSELNEISIIDIEGRNQNACFCQGKYLIHTKRTGLTPKEQDKEDYYLNIPLRYVVVLPESDFKQKIAGVENLVSYALKSNQIEDKDIFQILGYNKTF